jgi:hypothetical protein
MFKVEFSGTAAKLIFLDEESGSAYFVLFAYPDVKSGGIEFRVIFSPACKGDRNGIRGRLLDIADTYKQAPLAPAKEK